MEKHPVPPIPASDTTPPSVGEETQEIHPDPEETRPVPDQPEGEGGDGGEKYDGGEIPAAS